MQPQTALESAYTAISKDLELEAARLAAIRASVERCEALPTVTTHQLLNLPVRVGRLKE